MGLFGRFNKKPKQSAGEQEFYLSFSDKEHQRAHLERSSQLGCAIGKSALARYYLEHMPDDEEYMEKAAELYREAEVLGAKLNYETVAKVYMKLNRQEQAMENHLKAAEEGDMDAQFYSGYGYAIGRGVAQDYEKAAYWYQKAADQGVAAACNNLGNLYAEGLGVVQNGSKALELFEKSAEIGNALACGNAATHYYEGKIVPKNAEKAFLYGEKGTEEKDRQSQYILALLYNEGLGIKKDEKKSIELLEELVKQGYKKAEPVLEKFKEMLVQEAEQLYREGVEHGDTIFLKCAAEMGHVEACRKLLKDSLDLSKLYKMVYENEVDHTDYDLYGMRRWYITLREKGETLSEQEEYWLFVIFGKCSRQLLRQSEPDPGEVIFLLEPLLPYKNLTCMYHLAHAYYEHYNIYESKDMFEAILKHPDSYKKENSWMREEAQTNLDIIREQI